VPAAFSLSGASFCGTCFVQTKIFMRSPEQTFEYKRACGFEFHFRDSSQENQLPQRTRRKPATAGIVIPRALRG
jgi:hypothetical protein